MQGGLGAPAFQQRTVAAGLSFLCLCQRQRFFAKIDFSSQRTVIYWRVFRGVFFQEDVQRLKNSLPDQLYDTLDKSLYAIILKDLSNTSYLI